MLKTAIKLAISGVILYWVYQSGHLNFHLLQASWEQSKTSWVLSVLLFAFSVSLCTARWGLLLSYRNKVNLRPSKMLVIGWIGQFFNAVLPGAVTGDLIKVMYVKNHSDLSTKYLLGTIFIDRLIGLFSLVMILGCSVLFFPIETQDEALRLFLYGLPLSAICAFLLFLAIPACPLFLKKFPFLYDLWNEAILLKKICLGPILLSMASQMSLMFIFWLLTHNLASASLTLKVCYQVVPLGFISTAIPLAPSGLGVGHAAFQKLFEMNGITNGASLFNVYFTFGLAANLTGILPYLWFKKGKRVALNQEQKI